MSSDTNDRSELPDAEAEPAKLSDTPGLPPEEPLAAGEQAEGSGSDSESKTQPAPSETPPPEPTEADAEAAPKPPRRRRRILIGSQRDPAAYRPKPKRDSIPIVGLVRRGRRAAKGKPETKPRPEPDDQTTSQDQPAAPAKETTREGTPADDPVASTPQAAVEAQASTRLEPAPEPQQAAVEAQASTGLEPAPEPQQAAPEKPEEAAPEKPEQAAPEKPEEAAPEKPEEAAPEKPEEAALAEAVPEQIAAAPPPGKPLAPPNIREQLPPDLEDEFQQALGDAPIDELMASGEAVTKQPVLPADSQHTGHVVMVRREDVFVELGGREQGILPLKQFPESPELGAEVEVRVVRFDSEEGLYELARPGAAAAVGDWSDLEEGMVVEVRVTGHNSGGLECELNRLRGFIPVSQISLYRVEDLAQFVDEKMTCLITECNPERRNLVLSRRAVLEREREEARRNLLESLEPGQVREGVVRKLVDFGVFVDLGGVDGLVHISQLAWGRVDHPREVLQQGQTIQVMVQKVDKATGKISLAYRDLMESPWHDVERKYPENTSVRGKVTHLMEYGAFVELEPGVEGLVHISELSHKRVWRTSDVVNEGDEVDVLVLAVDAEAQRISLSMKDLIPEPKPAEAADQATPPEAEQPAPASKPRKKPSKPLSGGLGRSPGGDKFGLKW